MSIYKQYWTHQREHEIMYGQNKTLVLLQVGSFHESYHYDGQGPDLKEISEVTNLIVTSKNKKKPLSEQNPQMMGFPSVALHKYIRILIENGYTVVVFDQNKSNPEIRKKTGVYSPGTYMDDTFTPDANNMMCLYLVDEYQRGRGTMLTCIGIAIVDLTTGECSCHEVVPKVDDDKYSLDETHRLITALNPKEIIIYRDVPKNYAPGTHGIMTNDQLVMYFELKSNVYTFKGNVPRENTRINIQHNLLKKIYGHEGMLSPIEALDLEKMSYARVAFVTLLDYAYKHNSNILNNLNRPTIIDTNKFLILGNNALNQLNVFDDGELKDIGTRFRSLFDVVNQTSTPMGRRFLKSALCAPLTDVNEIQSRYDSIHEMTRHCNKFEPHLKSIVDIERLSRKICMKNIHPFELANLITSMEYIQEIFKECRQRKELIKWVPFMEVQQELDAFMEHFDTTFDMEETKKYNLDDITGSFFQPNVYPEIDQLHDEITGSMTFINNICDVLSRHVVDKKRGRPATASAMDSEGKRKIHLKKTDRDGYFLKLTKMRAESLKESLSKLDTLKITDNFHIDPKSIVFEDLPKGNETKIHFPELVTKSKNVDIVQVQLVEKIINEYNKILDHYSITYTSMFREMSKFIAYIDFFTSSAKVARTYRYFKPTIVEHTNGFIRCEDMRHPIVERIRQDREYIPTSLNLGHNDQDDNELDGILLYGVNSAGKSTCQKAVGICIIMAQAGMFVPARQFVFSPYHYLFARMTGNDNIFKGLSSFVLEMTELKAILQRVNEKTLVIGDEVCRGTEHISGNAIVAATVLNLAKTKCSFIFATHLHELMKLDVIKELNNVKPFHLSIRHDARSHALIFDRQLRPGSGDNLYGLMIARHIIQDNEFFLLAEDIKNDLLGIKKNLLECQTSRYNSQLIMEKCEACGWTPEAGDKGRLDTHHINFQKDCTDGFVDNKPHLLMNSEANLIVLCKECHEAVHKEEFMITGYLDTTGGRMVDIKQLVDKSAKPGRKNLRKVAKSKLPI